MSDVSKSITYSILVQVPTQIFGIIAGIFITRMLGPAGRGLYAIFYADVSLLTTLLDFSIITAIIYFTAAKKIASPKLRAMIIILSVITFLLSSLMVIVWINTPLADLLFPVDSLAWQHVVFFLVFLMISQVNTVYSGFFQGEKKFKLVNWVLLLNSMVNISTFAITFALHKLYGLNIGLNEILLLSLIILAINTIVWHFYFRRDFSYSTNFKLNWNDDVKPFFKFMGLAHLSNIISFFNYRLVLWILAYYLDDAQVGLFTLASGLCQMLYFISTPLSQVMLPYLSSESDENKIKLFRAFSRIHFTLLLVLAISGAICSPFLIPILYGENFSDSVIPFEILIGGIIFACQTRIFSSFLLSDQKVLINLIATIIGFGLTVLFNFIFISRYGIIGAAIAQSISIFGIFLFVCVALIIFTRIGKTNLFFITSQDIQYARTKFFRKG